MSTSAISITNLTKAYRKGFRRQPVKAVDSLSLTIEKGSVMGLIGPNGAGKTTTIYCLLGLLIPDSGSISIFGHDPKSVAARECMGFQSEIFHTYDFLRPKKALQFYGRLSGMDSANLDQKIDAQLEKLGLGQALNQKVGSFSKGMKQRLGVAQALLHDPELLILDEPFTGLDPEGRKLISDIVLSEKGRGKTIFFSSHILSDIERLCDQVTMIREGGVVMSGEMSDITATSDLWQITVSGWQEQLISQIEQYIRDISLTNDTAEVVCYTENKKQLLKTLLDLPVEITGMRTKSQSLEDLYMKIDNEQNA
jgi:ABC-2 type transport system ATP-binding protein